MRSSLIRERTAKANQLRGLVYEYGLVAPRELHALAPRGAGLAGGCRQWPDRALPCAAGRAVP